MMLVDVGGKQKKAELDSDTPALPTEAPTLRIQNPETICAVPHSLTPVVERLLKVVTPCSTATLHACITCCSFFEPLCFALA